MLFTGFTPLPLSEPPPGSCHPALRPAAAAASPLSYPSTGSWFPSGCESSFCLLRLQIYLHLLFLLDGLCSLPIRGFRSPALPGRESRGGWGGSWASSYGEDAAGVGWLVGCSVRRGLELEAQKEGNQGSASFTDKRWPFAARSDLAYLNSLPVQPQPHALSHSRTRQRL